MFWYWLISPFETQHLSACLIFSVPHLSPGLWKFLYVWMLIDIHVYNYKCTYLILSVILPVLRPFLPHFLPHALCTKNLTSTTLNQTLQYPTFREKCQLQQSSNVFVLLCWLQRAALWFSACQKFPKVTDQPLNPLHLPCGLWSGLAVVPVCNQLLCVLMVAVTPRFSSKGVLFCLLYCYNHRYFSQDSF